MRIEIEIPKEFEEHFKQDKFEDSLERLNTDAHLIAGNYERETVTMLIKAFKESKPAYDIESIIEEIARRDTTDGTVKVFSGREVIDIIRSGGQRNV